MEQTRANFGLWWKLGEDANLHKRRGQWNNSPPRPRPRPLPPPPPPPPPPTPSALPPPSSSSLNSGFHYAHSRGFFKTTLWFILALCIAFLFSIFTRRLLATWKMLRRVFANTFYWKFAIYSDEDWHQCNSCKSATLIYAGEGEGGIRTFCLRQNFESNTDTIFTFICFDLIMPLFHMFQVFQLQSIISGWVILVGLIDNLAVIMAVLFHHISSIWVILKWSPSSYF